MSKVGLYVRVSTDKQKEQGISIDAQIDALVKYCDEHNYEYEIYNDAGISAHASYKKRPALLKLIDDCQQGKISLILFCKLDRWFRSVKDYYLTMEQIGGIPWIAIWEDYETLTPSGVLKTNIMLSVSESEALQASQRTKAIVEYKRSQGHYVGKAPIGYVIHEKGLIKDVNTQDAVQAIFDTYLKTFSSREACNVAKEHGLPMERQHIIKMLHRTAYYGDASGYKCEPYITKEQWDIIQDNMQSHAVRTPQNANRVYMFSGLCICGYCGNRMSGHAVIRPNREHLTYSCAGSSGSRRTCPHLQIQETHIERYLLEHIDALLCDYKHSIGTMLDSSDMSALIKRRDALNNKLKRLANLYADGDIELDEYRAQRDTIKNELLSIKINKASLPDLPDGWKDIYNDLDPKHRQMFWKQVINSIIITNETKQSPNIIFK